MARILYHRIVIYFNLCKAPIVELIYFQWKDAEIAFHNLSSKINRNFGLKTIDIFLAGQVDIKENKARADFFWKSIGIMKNDYRLSLGVCD